MLFDLKIFIKKSIYDKVNYVHKWIDYKIFHVYAFLSPEQKILYIILEYASVSGTLCPNHLSRCPSTGVRRNSCFLLMDVIEEWAAVVSPTVCVIVLAWLTVVCGVK